MPNGMPHIMPDERIKLLQPDREVVELLHSAHGLVKQWLDLLTQLGTPRWFLYSPSEAPRTSEEDVEKIWREALASCPNAATLYSKVADVLDDQGEFVLAQKVRACVDATSENVV